MKMAYKYNVLSASNGHEIALTSYLCDISTHVGLPAISAACRRSRLGCETELLYERLTWVCASTSCTKLTVSQGHFPCSKRMR